MSSPEVVAAIESLREKHILSEVQANAFLPPARGELVSIRAELRTLLYGGVLLVAAGVGIFLEESHERLGPTLVATLVAVLAASGFVYALRRSPPFSRGRTESPHVAADYLLLLAMLLVASDLAYVEAQFRILGPRWPYHFLVVALLCFAAAYRFDSRSVLTLALASFAAWRGVAAGMPFAVGLLRSSAAIRANAIVLGALYVAAGALGARTQRKAHFEPVWTAAGLILVFGGILSGVLISGSWLRWEAVLAGAASAVLAVAYRLRRPLDFAIALAAAYAGGLRALGRFAHDSRGLFWIAAWSVAVLVVLIAATRRMRRPA
jgi:hypothetical protein